MARDAGQDIARLPVRRAQGLPLDLLVIAAALLVAALAREMGSLVVAALVAAPVLLFAPGYALLLAFYPRDLGHGLAGQPRRFLGTWEERAVVAPALSLALVPLVAYVLDQTQEGITAQRLQVAFAGLLAALLVLAAVRWFRVPPEQRWAMPLPDRRTLAWVRARPVGTAVAVVGLLAVASAAGWVARSPVEPEPLTEFYVLGPTGFVACLPDVFTGQVFRSNTTTVTCPQQINGVLVGIANHEGRTVDYLVAVSWEGPDGFSLVDMFNVTLPSQPVEARIGTEFEPQFEQNVSLTPPPGRGMQDLVFRLFVDTAFEDLGGTEPHRLLRIRVHAS